jgi:hypothetical protein
MQTSEFQNILHSVERMSPNQLRELGTIVRYKNNTNTAAINNGGGGNNRGGGSRNNGTNFNRRRSNNQRSNDEPRTGRNNHHAWRTKPCRNGKDCPFGTECNFKHDPSDFEDQTTDTSKKVDAEIGDVQELMASVADKLPQSVSELNWGDVSEDEEEEPIVEVITTTPNTPTAENTD